MDKNGVTFGIEDYNETEGGNYEMENNFLTVITYGYISPVVASLTIITNCLVCIVLLQTNMRK